MSCDLGIHRAIAKILNNKPWFKYKEGDKFIEIINSPNLNINEKNAIGVAQTVAKEINKEINIYYPNVGDIVYSKFLENKTVVNIEPTSKQLNYINEKREIERQEIEKEFAKEQLDKEFENKDIYNGDEYLKEQSENNLKFKLKNNNLQQSKASKETLEKLIPILNKLGINVYVLEKYLKDNPNVRKDINGLADLAKGVIAIAIGKESEALTEELVHIATAIIEQTNPKLITNLISQISKYKIYNKTFEIYKTKYLTADGKPDIRKIKKEAVDKLIAEWIINKAEGSEQFPELMEKETQNFVETIWEAITTFIRQLYNSSNVNLFEQVAEDILNNNIEGTISDLKNNNVFYQIAKNLLVEEKRKILSQMAKDVILTDIKETPTTPKERYYTYLGKKLKYTVTSLLGKKELNRTDSEKKLDNQKKEWGSAGHEYIYNYISNNLIDENGYKLETPNNTIITTTLSVKVQKELKDFCEELINSYAEGTAFLVETNVVNEKAKGKDGMGSAIDFVAIEPVKTKNKEGIEVDDIKVDILDWKFTTVNNKDQKDSDVIVSKQLDWKRQMGEYSKIMYNIGIERSQLRKARMLPFIANYVYTIKNDKTSPLKMTSIEIGKLNSIDETKLYLLPTSLTSESTGNTYIDEYVESLNAYYNNQNYKAVDLENKSVKDAKMKQLSAAIKKLQLQLNFEPLYNVAKTFLIDIKTTVDEYKNKDFSSLTKEESKKLLQSLIEFGNSSNKFLDIDDIYLKHVDKKTITSEQLKLLKDFEMVSKATKKALKEVLVIQNKFATQNNLEEGFLNNVLEAEKAAGGLNNNYTEGSKMPVAIAQLIGKKTLLAKSETVELFSKMANEYGKKLKALTELASLKNVKAFSLIGEVVDGKLQLFQKLSKEFIKKIDDARVKFDRKTLLENVNIDGYNKDIQSYILAGTKNIENTQHSADEIENQEEVDRRKEILLNSIQLDSKNFNGFENSAFRKYYDKHIIQEGNYSKEYKNLLNNKPALDVWEFFTMLNEKAIKSGYINKQGLSFFPLLEATFAQKLGNGNNILTETGDFFKDLVTSTPNEDIGFGKVDEETGELRLSIPKLFTQTNKEIDQLSTDLLKTGLTWLKSVIEYDSKKELEYEILTLIEVEKNKKSIVVDENGEIVFKNGEAKTKKGSENIEAVKAQAFDSLYGLTENKDSMGNAVLNSASALTGAEDIEKRTIQYKKLLQNSDAYLRMLALGLKLPLGIANLAGYMMQSYINSGTHYSESDFRSYIVKVMTPFVGGLSLEEKALIDYFIPLNGEDPLVIKQRQLAKGQSYKSYLSTWTFSDVMMITNSFGEKRIELANAATIIKNSMVINGKIINIRQYLKKQDQVTRQSLSETERRTLEKSFETRVKELQKSDKALSKIVKFENDELVIPNISSRELAKFRISIIDIARAASGQMSNDDKMGHRRDTLFRSFMMFKTWIPKLLQTRFKNIAINSATDQWEYGRYKAFADTFKTITFKNITDLRDIIVGTDKGIAIINKMLEAKKEQHFRKTGKVLTITANDYQDMIRQQVTNMMKELALLVGMISLMIAAKIVAPDDDDDDLTKNRYKYIAKVINKITQELTFFVNPMSADEVTRGSIIPALGLVTKVEKAISAVFKESYYTITDNEEKADKTYPTKYVLNLFPGPSQFINEILPFIYPEEAKDLGIKVQIESKK